MTLAAFLAYISVYGSAAITFVVANWGTISAMISAGMTIASVIQWVLQQI